MSHAWEKTHISITLTEIIPNMRSSSHMYVYKRRKLKMPGTFFTGGIIHTSNNSPREKPEEWPPGLAHELMHSDQLKTGGFRTIPSKYIMTHLHRCRELSAANKLRQISFLWMLESDSDRRAFHRSTQHRTFRVVGSRACGTVTRVVRGSELGAGLTMSSGKPFGQTAVNNCCCARLGNHGTDSRLL